MRTGLTVHGLNTASTIWCSAAIGVLSGGGFFAAAFLGTTYELLLLLRPKGKQEMTSLLQAAVARDRDARMAFVKAGIPRAGQRYQFERASEDTPTMRLNGRIVRYRMSDVVRIEILCRRPVSFCSRRSVPDWR
jgi:uncharacterized membrane protein YhiD involved in acid resistance